jgi:hypothetical protein
MGTRRLSNEVQTYIVQEFARWRTPTQIAEAVKEEFGLDLDRQRVAFYNAERGGKQLPQKWKDLFVETRKSYLANVDSVGIAHRTFRLSMLHRLALAAEERGQVVIALSALEQAAKETGDVFTNKRKFEIEDKRKKLADLLGVSPDELPVSPVPNRKEFIN